MPNGLHRIAMKICAICMTQFSDGMNICQSSNFIVGVHERNERFFCIVAQKHFKMLHIYTTFFINIDKNKFYILKMRYIFSRMKHTMMLNRRSDNSSNAKVAHRIFYRHIIGFCTARSEKNLSDRCTKTVRYAFASVFYGGTNFAPVVVNGRRISM